MPNPLRKTDFTTLTVASGQTVSQYLELGGYDLLGITVPSNFDGTTIGFQVSPDGTTFSVVNDGESGDLSITCAASRYVPMKNVALLAGALALKLTTGTVQSVSNTVFTMHLREIQ